MEHLTIQGSVVIDGDAPTISVLRLIGHLTTITFNGIGRIKHHFDPQTLQFSLYVDGPVDEETTQHVRQQLDQLRGMLAENSHILVIRERWEVTITLWSPAYAREFLKSVFPEPHQTLHSH